MKPHIPYRFLWYVFSGPSIPPGRPFLCAQAPLRRGGGALFSCFLSAGHADAAQNPGEYIPERAQAIRAASAASTSRFPRNHWPAPASVRAVSTRVCRRYTGRVLRPTFSSSGRGRRGVQTSSTKIHARATAHTRSRVYHQKAGGAVALRAVKPGGGPAGAQEQRGQHRRQERRAGAAGRPMPGDQIAQQMAARLVIAQQEQRHKVADPREGQQVVRVRIAATARPSSTASSRLRAIFRRSSVSSRGSSR